MSKEAMKLALEALESCTPADTSTSHVIYAWHDEELVNKAIKALEEALAKQEQGEPVAHFGSAYVNENGVHVTTVLDPVAIPQDAKFYTTPPQGEARGLSQQQRKPLTDEEIGAILEGVNAYGTRLYTFARAIEAAHGIKE